jgi:hypothetical protein
MPESGPKVSRWGATSIRQDGSAKLALREMNVACQGPKLPSNQVARLWLQTAPAEASPGKPCFGGLER